MSWAWEITSLGGTAGAIVEPRKATIQRNLNGPSSCVLELDAGQASQAVHGRLVKGWREPNAGGARVLRSHTQITEVNASVATDALERVSVASVDGYGMLSRRNTLAEYNYTATSPRGIVYDFVSVENGRRVVGLDVPATGVSGPNRDRQYDAGKNVGEAVQQLAEVDDGFYFRVDPYQGTSGAYTLFSQFIILYPASGVTSTARFEYGTGTLGNIQSAEVTVTPPINYVTAYGAGDVGSQITSTQSNAASISGYGLFDSVQSFSDVELQATLDQHALDAMEIEPVRVYKFNPVRFGPNLPSPWDDFEVGDFVTFKLAGSTPYLQTTKVGRVIAYTVEVETEGVEFLTEIVLEVV